MFEPSGLPGGGPVLANTMSLDTNTIQTISADDFVRGSRSAFDQLREAVRRVIAAVPVDGDRPTDLGRALDLDYALAWQLHALAGEPDLQMTARFVPKPGAMERFLLAAERLAPAEIAEGARRAYGAFERTVADLAGDRGAFDAMLTLQRPDDAAGLKKARRAAHRANVAVWGVTCRCKAHATVFRTRPTGEFDSLSVLGYVGLQRLQANAMVSTLAATRTWAGGTHAPEEGAKAQFECGLIEEACSRPLPRIEREVGAEGTPQEFLEIDGLGKRSEATVYWRTTSLDVPDTTGVPPHNLSSTCRIPAERMLLDFLLPRGWVRGDITAWVAPWVGRYVSPEPGTRHKLPFEGAGRYLGRSLSALHSAAAPQHAGLVRSEIERLGWGDTEFDIFRCEVQYPVLHSVVNMRVE